MSLVDTREMESDDRGKMFEELYKTQYRVLYHLALSILRRPQVAEDAVQETFAHLAEPKVLRQVERMSKRETHRFLYAITKNIALSVLKREKREESLSLWRERYRIEDIAGNDGEMKELYDKLELEELIVALKKLPDIYSTIMTLKYMKQLEDKEIADIHHITPALVRKRLERGRKKLREQYGKEFLD